MSKKSYFTLSAVLFLFVGILHLARSIFGWEIAFNGVAVPFWVSWAAVVATGILAFYGFKFRSK